MRGSAIVCAICILAGVACAGAYRAIGASVDDDGVLREPFFLIPIGNALVVIGVAGWVSLAARRLLRR